MKLTGSTLCTNLLQAETLFPKSHALVHECARALERCSMSYSSVLIDIYIKRDQQKIKPLPDASSLELLEMKKHLADRPPIRLVKDLKDEGIRIWGCIPESEDDVLRLGSDICLNSDMILALENTTDPWTEKVCKILICVTYAHELMHKIHHKLFPHQRLENMPPGVGTDHGESGWALENKIFGGITSVTWPSDSIGDFSKVMDLTIEEKGVRKKLTAHHLDIFFAGLAQGDICKLTSLTNEVVPDPSPPYVDGRGTARPLSASRAGLGRVLPPDYVVPPGYVLSRVTMDCHAPPGKADTMPYQDSAPGGTTHPSIAAELDK
ncbi:hypothetical protein K438DRAFT_1961757 [Mycena galopus ATCC 62051]|nr:hypothetical protein K438DRAFT_1961757 [Mycena galopus ATCC 62051]